jgi:hypothetical protein
LDSLSPIDIRIESSCRVTLRITDGFSRPVDAIVLHRPRLTRYLEFKDVFYESEMAIK